MPFPADVAEQLLVKSARHCCLCRQFKGQKIEIHHIEQEADGGASTFENGLPVCFDCHAEVQSYNDKHPRGRKYRASELKQLRDQWFKLVAEGKTGGQPPVVIRWLTEPPPNPLSPAAQEILTKAAEVPGIHRGIIVVAETLSGTDVSPGGNVELYPTGDIRQEQRYLEALAELEARKLVSPRSKEVRALTTAGFDLADELLKRG